MPIRVVATTRIHPDVGYGSTTVRGEWPPVLVGFVRPEDPLLADVSSWAETTSVSVEVGQRLRYVSGMIVVKVGHDRRFGYGSGGRLPWVRLFEHELAHLVGLRHVNDPRSLLYPTILDRPGLTPGDRIGLRLLGGSPRGAPCPDRGRRSGEHPGTADKVASLESAG